MNELDSPFFMRGIPISGPHDITTDQLVFLKADHVVLQLTELAKKLFPEFNIEAGLVNMIPFPLGEVSGPKMVLIRSTKKVDGKTLSIDRFYNVSEVANLTPKKLLSIHMEIIINMLIDGNSRRGKKKKKFAKNKGMR